jgi:hypothetical protein
MPDFIRWKKLGWRLPIAPGRGMSAFHPFRPFPDSLLQAFNEAISKFEYLRRMGGGRGSVEFWPQPPFTSRPRNWAGDFNRFCGCCRVRNRVSVHVPMWRSTHGRPMSAFTQFGHSDLRLLRAVSGVRSSSGPLERVDAVEGHSHRPVSLATAAQELAAKSRAVGPPRRWA